METIFKNSLHNLCGENRFAHGTGNSEMRNESTYGKWWVGFAIDCAEHPWPSVGTSCFLKRKV